MYKSIVEAVFHYSDITPNKLCLADDKGFVSYGGYKDEICRYAACLAGMGLGKSDRVVIEANQSVDYLAIELALHLIGAVFVPVEHNCTADKIRTFVGKTKAKAVIVNHSDTYPDCRCYTYMQLCEMCQVVNPFPVKEFPKTDEISEILFSTGTTGNEKGIVITHKNDIALAENVMYGVKMEKDNIEMIPSPMNHSHGLRRYYANMVNGSSVVLLGSIMDVRGFFGNMERYLVNAIDLVPSALSVLLKLSKDKLKDYQHQLRYIQFGSAPLSENDKEKIISLLPETRLYNFYGSTESGCSCIYNFNSGNQKPNCIGKPTYNSEIFVVDSDRRPIVSSPEQSGLLATKGDMNMRGYYGDECETQKVLADKTVYSGDIGYIDSDGDVILLGRKGDVMNIGGKKVSPEEIEDAAKQMPGIADCACIPISDPAKGQIPKLFVQMDDSSTFDPIKIRNFLSEKLEPYKIPSIIEMISKIPRSFNGKVLRKNLQ